MGMLVEGLNLIRTFWSNLNDKGSLGTGTTQETGQDTGLEIPVISADTTYITIETADQFVRKSAIFSGVNADESYVTEMVWGDNETDVAGCRITFSEIKWIKTADTVIKSGWYFKGRRD